VAFLEVREHGIREAFIIITKRNISSTLVNSFVRSGIFSDIKEPLSELPNAFNFDLSYFFTL